MDFDILLYSSTDALYTSHLSSENGYKDDQQGTSCHRGFGKCCGTVPVNDQVSPERGPLRCPVGAPSGPVLAMICSMYLLLVLLLPHRDLILYGIKVLLFVNNLKRSAQDFVDAILGLVNLE